jgi:hypothetical protein
MAERYVQNVAAKHVEELREHYTKVLELTNQEELEDKYVLSLATNYEERCTFAPRYIGMLGGVTRHEG